MGAPPASGSMTRPAHFVGVRFLNSRPLVAGLEAGLAAPFPFTYAAADPAECAAALAARTAAAALVPVVTLSQAPWARPLDNLGVACRGAVHSVLLVSKVPLEEIHVVAAHAASRTSEVLARLLLSERTARNPAVVRCSPPLEGMLRCADAAVVIGDAAMSLRGRTGLLEMDLGEAWREWTGLPFVFAQWAVDERAPSGVERLLEGSLAWAEQHWEHLLPRWAEQHALTLAEVREYLQERLHFRLDANDQRGKETFLQLAAARGLLPTATPLFRTSAGTVQLLP